MHSLICIINRHQVQKRLGVFLLCVFLAGCGNGKDQLKTYPAQGKATFQGQPIEYAQITLFPIGGEAKAKHLLPRGMVVKDGSYVLGTYEVGDGAPPGRYKVTITWPNPPGSEAMRPDQPNDKLQGRYARVDDSKFEFTIEEKENTLPPIDLQ